MKKINSTITIIAIFVIALTAILVFGGNDILKGRSGGNSNKGEVLTLVGSGRELNGGIASSTSPSTIFQFASSTNEVWWDTDTHYPHRYGATTTASFAMGSADTLTFDIVYNPANADSLMNLNLLGSNDANSSSGLSSVSDLAEWFPFQISATTTLSDMAAQQATTTMQIAPGAVGQMKISFTLENINYDSVRLQVDNASTTDASTLHIEVRKY